jgi:hypothetical protein
MPFPFEWRAHAIGVPPGALKCGNGVIKHRHPPTCATCLTFDMAHDERRPLRCWPHTLLIRGSALELPLLQPGDSRTVWTTVTAAANLSGIAKSTLADAIAVEPHGKRLLGGMEELRPIKEVGALGANAPNVMIVQIPLVVKIMKNKNMPKDDIEKVSALRLCDPPPQRVAGLADIEVERAGERPPDTYMFCICPTLLAWRPTGCTYSNAIQCNRNSVLLALQTDTTQDTVMKAPVQDLVKVCSAEPTPQPPAES